MNRRTFVVEVAAGIVIIAVTLPVLWSLLSGGNSALIEHFLVVPLVSFFF